MCNELSRLGSIDPFSNESFINDDARICTVNEMETPLAFAFIFMAVILSL